MNKEKRSIKIVRGLSNLLEGRFSILGFRFGLDPILGLIPGIGDFISLVLAFGIIYTAIDLRLPQELIIKMVVNLIYDFIIGSIPIVGDIADFFYKSNERNLKIIEKYLAKDETVEGEIIEG